MQQKQTFIITAATLLSLIVALLTNIVTGGTFIPLGPAWFFLGLAVVMQIALIVIQTSQSASPTHSYSSPSPTLLRRSFLRTSLGAGLVVAGGISAFWLLRTLFHSENTAPSSKIAKVAKPLFVYTGHTGQILGIDWEPDGKHIVSSETPSATSGNEAINVLVWDSVTGETRTTFRGHNWGAFALAWSPDGTSIASGGGAIQIWEPFTGKQRFKAQGDGVVTGIAWSHDSKRLAVASNNYQDIKNPVGSVRLWGTNSQSPLSTFPDHEYAQGVSWSPDDKYIVSSTYKRVLVWTPDGRSLYSYPFSEQGALAWSPDGKYIVSANQVWDTRERRIIATYTGHSSVIRAAVWSPTSRYIATASYDGTVQVWEATTAQHIITFNDEPHINNHGFWAVAWSHDGKRIAAGGDSSKVYIWQAPQ